METLLLGNQEETCLSVTEVTRIHMTTPWCNIEYFFVKSFKYVLFEHTVWIINWYNPFNTNANIDRCFLYTKHIKFACVCLTIWFSTHLIIKGYGSCSLLIWILQQQRCWYLFHQQLFQSKLMNFYTNPRLKINFRLTYLFHAVQSF